MDDFRKDVKKKIKEYCFDIKTKSPVLIAQGVIIIANQKKNLLCILIHSELSYQSKEAGDLYLQCVRNYHVANYLEGVQ